ncbi:MAG: glycoside hydrolase family 2 TIM barrel-domain containing protein, partial [Caldilineaceae bacterium]
PETPSLYTVTAALVLDGAELHSATKRCGFRTVDVRDGRIVLNGAPIYLRGVLDQGYFAETIYTPPSRELLVEQARTIKAMGFNCLRIHIKIEDPRYYDVADEVGMLVWTEIPNWVLLTDDVKRRALDTFTGMLTRDGHHPSIIAWTLINENWGTDLTRDPDHRRWLADFTREAKALDPTRLVVDNSACCDNAHVAGDLDDFHHYRVLPDHAHLWDAWVADYASRPAWSWYQDHAENRRADLPLIVSEFGNWGLPDPAEIREAGKEPWWFESGSGWDDGQVYPHGVEQRFVTSGLATLFPSMGDFARASQQHMVRSLHYEISTMRLHKAVAGYIVTELSDVQWEPNGLLTTQRKPKAGTETLLAAINQDNVVVLRPLQWSGRPGECVRVVVATSSVDGDERHGQIVWRAGEASGTLAAPGGTVEVPLIASGMVTLEATWLDESGATLAVNGVELACVAVEPPATTLRVLEEGALAASLRALGYDVTVGLQGALGDPTAIVAAHSYNEALQ